mmetsp:Transcript_17890/g.33916  ORF Transcript_17890/g.33916 Transcript_17890/m.33916 type:complete len:230 (+) Transcript_17890:817-1506(+)
MASRVDDINLVQGNGMDHFFAFLEFVFRTLYETSHRSHRVVVMGSRERTSKLGDATRCLVYGDHVPSSDLLLAEGLNHFLSQIVHGFHVGCLHSDLARFISRSIGGSLDLDLNHFSLDDLRFFLDADPNGSPECLCQGLGLAHLHREELTGCQARERRVFSEGLRHAHSDGSLTGTRLASKKNGSSRNFSLLDHLQDHSSRFASLQLPHKTLRVCAGLQGIIQAETTDM